MKSVASRPWDVMRQHDALFQQDPMPLLDSSIQQHDHTRDVHVDSSQGCAICAPLSIKLFSYPTCPKKTRSAVSLPELAICEDGGVIVIEA